MVPVVRCAICHHRCHGVFGADFGGVIKMIYVYVTYIMMNFLAVTVTTPCTALLPNLTTNAQERVNANAFRNVGGQIGVIASGMLTLPLVNLIGGGNQQLGFTVTMIIYGVICVGLLLLTFANTRERVFTLRRRSRRSSRVSWPCCTMGHGGFLSPSTLSCSLVW